jgi:hypothetical protein
VPQGIFEDALLGRHLRSNVHVLQAASAAYAVVRARGHYALSRSAQQLARTSELVGGLAPVGRELDALARQSAFDEYRLALPAAYAASFLIERIDVDDAFGRGASIY